MSSPSQPSPPSPPSLCLPLPPPPHVLIRSILSSPSPPSPPSLSLPLWILERPPRREKRSRGGALGRARSDHLLKSLGRSPPPREAVTGGASWPRRVLTTSSILLRLLLFVLQCHPVHFVLFEFLEAPKKAAQSIDSCTIILRDMASSSIPVRNAMKTRQAMAMACEEFTVSEQHGDRVYRVRAAWRQGF